MSKILIIEDERDIEELLRFFLEDSGYEVAVARDGLEGITAFQKDRYDLILLDIMLPKIDGFAVCELIRKESNIPVIMITALSSEEEQVRGLDLLADDYITKPFSMPVLIRKIAAVLRRSGRGAKAGENQKLIYRDLCLDLDNYQTFVDGEPVALTKREFEILRELLNHQGKVMTREILLEKLWKYEFYGNDRVVDNHCHADNTKTTKGTNPGILGNHLIFDRNLAVLRIHMSFHRFTSILRILVRPHSSFYPERYLDYTIYL